MSEDNARLNNLLKWSIENSVPAANTTSETTSTPNTQSQQPSQPPSDQQQPHRGLDAATLAALLGGPSDADLMKDSMTSILDTSIPVDDRLIAFDNFEQLIESLDNANNMAPLGLWTPLLSQLEASEAEIRKMAAWCVGTAVQNNAQAQERALVGGAVPKLVGMVKRESEDSNRRKARYAVSSLVRNYQPGLDALVEELGRERGSVDAGDMEGIDALLEDMLKRE